MAKKSQHFKIVVPMYNVEKWIDKCKNHLDWNNKGSTKFLNFTMKDFWMTYDNFWIDATKNKSFYKCEIII